MELYPFSLQTKERVWESQQVVASPFDELILSWNGFRPLGFWTFFVSLRQTIPKGTQKLESNQGGGADFCVWSEGHCQRLRTLENSPGDCFPREAGERSEPAPQGGPKRRPKICCQADAAGGPRKPLRFLGKGVGADQFLIHEGYTWSPWLKYAEWGTARQKTFSTAPDHSFAKTYQDAVFPRNGRADAFRIRVQASTDSDLSSLHSLTVCCSGDTKAERAARRNPSPSGEGRASYFSGRGKELQFAPLAAASLKGVPKQSQMVLDHPRCRDLCSPTSTAMAVSYLSKQRIDPIVFAAASRDEEFDIYGNWILNTAAAYEALQGKYCSYVARLDSFSQALAQIAKGLPVVVSVKGPLAGSPEPYASGHLIFLTGYNPIERKVLCMDPGFSSTEETETAYPLDSFLEAWGRRKNLAYLFSLES